MTSIHPTAAAGFSQSAAVYERARPSYPAEAVAWLCERTGLGPGKVVVDVGAGTGKLTRLLCASGARVVAVEPIPEMRALIGDGVEILAGTAEQLPLPDGAADVVVAAQAFHWFDQERALPELHRVLAADGVLALVWNSRDLADPLQRALEDLLAPHRAGVLDQQQGAWREPLQRSTLFGPLEQRSFRYEQHLGVEGLCGRVESTSFVAAMPAVERETLLVQVRSLAAGLADPFPFAYTTEVYVAPRSRDSAD